MDMGEQQSGAVLRHSRQPIGCGRATWDFAGLSPAAAVASPPVTTTATNAFVWVEDALPDGAVPNTDGGDSWTWVNSNPAPFSGALANQSALRTGLHQHYFDQAT